MYEIKPGISSLILAILLCSSGTAFGQATAFSYQGKLADSGNPANGQYDFQFKLFDTGTVGTGAQLGGLVVVSNVTVTTGVFTVQIDFGACASCFDGSARFLEIALKPTSGSTFTTLGPRQPLTAAPYAIKSQSASAADGLSVACVNCITSSQIQSVQGSQVTGNIAGSQITGLVPVSSVPAGSANYVQNTNSQQATSNFNISGQGTVGGTLSGNIVNATTQYNILGSRVLTIPAVNNTFTGLNAGRNTLPFGTDNSFFGYVSGAGTSGDRNSFFGSFAGLFNTTGSDNTFIGSDADFTDSSFPGDKNTLLGSSARLNAFLSNATAIGANASVTQSNSLVLGSINGVNNATANTSVGIGLTAPNSKLDVVDTAAQIRFGDTATDDGGYLVSTQPSQAIISGGAKWNGSAWIAKSTAASLIDNNGGGILFFTDSGLTAGSTFTPTQRMTVAASGAVTINGTLAIGALGAANTTTTLCRNSSNQIATCNSSSLRYKTDIKPFLGGLELVKRLRPISFIWKQGGARDIGFGAEDVARVEPLFTFTNEHGEIEGVKYDRLSVALVNTAQEQQQQIERQQSQINAQQTLIMQQSTLAQHQEAQLAHQRAEILSQRKEIEGLKRLVCSGHTNAAICKRLR